MSFFKDEKNIGIGILAGGKSTRMGENKAFLKLQGERIIDRLVRELSFFSVPVISAAERGLYDDMGLKVILDETMNIGPIEGIRRLLSESENEYIFICAVDMPRIDAKIVSYIAEFISSDYDCFVIVDDEKIHPLCAIYSKRMLPIIERQIACGIYRLTSLLNIARTKYIQLSYTCFDNRVVRNINTREDYETFLRPVVFCVCGRKNTGKTGFIERLINEFISEGFSVGVIKHDGHDCFLDRQESDTERFFSVGALETAVYSESRVMIHTHEKKSAEDIVFCFSKLENSPDVIIVEGGKTTDYPKLELVREEISKESMISPEELMLIATDIIQRDEVSCPVFGLEDVIGVFFYLKKFFGLEK